MESLSGIRLHGDRIARMALEYLPDVDEIRRIHARGSMDYDFPGETALRLLASTGSRLAVEYLRKLIGVRDGYCEQVAVENLALMTSPESQHLLIALLEDQNAELRRQAVGHLLARNHAPALGVLVETLNDVEPFWLEFMIRDFQEYTQQYLGYDEELPQEEKARIIQTCRRWWTDHGRDFDMIEARRRIEVDQLNL